MPDVGALPDLAGTGASFITRGSASQPMLHGLSMQDLAQADLSISKSDGVTTIVAGDPITYTIVITNAGPDPVSGATVVDDFPLTLQNPSWTCTASPGSFCPASGDDTINTSIDLLPNGTATFIVTATVNPFAYSVDGGTITNSASVSVSGNMTDPDLNNNTSTDTTTIVQRQADLAISKTDGRSMAFAGEPITYTIVVTNTGPHDISNALVSDTFPAIDGVTWQCTGVGGATCTASGNGSIAEIVSMPVGSTVTFVATGVLDPNAAGTLTNLATVEIPPECVECAPRAEDPNLANNVATDVTQVGVQADVSVTKQDSADPVQLGTTLTYTLVVANQGPSMVTSAYLTDTLPVGTIFNGVTTTQGTCSGSGSLVTCTLTDPLITPIDSILLIDDDGNAPDVRAYYTAALDALGYTYSIFDTASNGGSGPGAAIMNDYDLVIWFGGAYGSPDSADEAALAAYLDNGGRLFLIAQDYHYNMGEVTTPFMADYLGVNTITSDVEPYLIVTGTNALTGHDGYALSTPDGFDLYVDAITPGAIGIVGMVSSTGRNAGIYSNDGRTVFFAFPWEAIQNNSAANGQALLQAIIEHLSIRPVPLAVGSLVTVTVTVSVNAAGVLTNTVEVGAHVHDPNPANNIAHEVTRVLAPGIVVSPTSGLITTEAGGSTTFTMVLTSQPASTVTIELSSSHPNEGTVAPATLVFDTGNWSSPQVVTVTGVDDHVDDDDRTYTIVTAPASSSDPSYNGINAPDVRVTNIDNEHRIFLPVVAPSLILAN